jgi:ferredoxin--NADP+ reductase
MPKVIKSEMIVPNIHLLTVESPTIARQVQPGQFVIVRADEDSERIPLSIADWDTEEGTVTVLLMNVGSSTSSLASLKAGMNIATMVGPLGNPTEIEKFGNVVCLGGCYGIGSIFPIARALKEKGNQVITVIEARSSYLFYWEEKLKEVSDKIFYVTRNHQIIRRASGSGHHKWLHFSFKERIGYYPTFRYKNHSQLESYHARRHGNVRCVSAHCWIHHQICLRAWSGF